MMSKRVFLVRHGESENNVDKRESRRFLRGGYSKGQLAHLMNLFRVDMNSPLTERGRDMSKVQRDILNMADFIKTEGIDLCLHSPLQRARETAEIMFGTAGIKVEEHPLLYEKTLFEYAFGGLKKRTENVKKALLSMHEPVIILVGHGGFFNSFAGQRLFLANCEVVRCTLSDDLSVTDIVRYYKGGEVL